MEAQGFILQASYRIRERVPVVHLYGRLTGGESFLLRDARPRPSFYVRAAAQERALAAGAARVAPTSLKTFGGDDVVRVEVAVPPDVPPLRDALQARGVDTFEADVRFAVRYLMDHGVRGGCRIRGEATRGDHVDWIFDEPELEGAEVSLSPRVLSFDIETSPDAQRLLAIALFGRAGSGAPLDEVLVVDPGGRAMPQGAIGFADERAVLDAFCERVRAFDPDVLTGWNVIDFDLSVLQRVAARLRHPFRLGRDSGELRIRPARGYFGSGQAQISGRLVLDGIDAVRGAFLRFDEYGLDAVAREVLGEGKTLSFEGDDKGEAISRRYEQALDSFVEYARADARLALEILEALDLVPLAFARSRLTGMTPDRVSGSIASFDFLYLSELKTRGYVAPTVKSAASAVPQAGGQVFEPVTGLHDGVWVFDFKSLYPSIMRTFNIDPLGWVPPEQVDAARHIVLEDGAAFRRDEAILPALLDELFPSREAAKARGDAVASQAIKILMNSFYGVLGTPACRFHNAAIANAITGEGRRLLKWTRSWFETRGYPVLYGDTDSVFVSSADAASRLQDDADALSALGARLAAEASADLAGEVRERWGLDSRLELEFEKLYTRLFLPSVRHGSAGARKRYAGQKHGDVDIEFVGMEVVRRDWTELAKRVQRELYRRLFAGEDVVDYLEETVRGLRRGAFDELLVYRKGLRKRLDSYVASTPPHVAAARKLEGPPPRVIAYVMTTAGPEPVEMLVSEPDREHYVQKQVRPVAEGVLEALGLDFPQVVGDDRQLGLF